MLDVKPLKIRLENAGPSVSLSLHLSLSPSLSLSLYHEFVDRKRHAFSCQEKACQNMCVTHAFFYVLPIVVCTSNAHILRAKQFINMFLDVHITCEALLLATSANR